VKRIQDFFGTPLKREREDRDLDIIISPKKLKHGPSRSPKKDGEKGDEKKELEKSAKLSSTPSKKTPKSSRSKITDFFKPSSV
jgi:hypothetical protein